MKIFATAITLFLALSSKAQDYRWQQHASYTMAVELDTKTHQMAGSQKLVYTNNSKDTLDKVYYHLFFNAFQPGSMMDVRSRNLPDPDPRVDDRISKLKENEIGYHKIHSLLQDGQPTSYHVNGTVLEVILNKPILPGSPTIFDMKFESQVPVQIRRSGRNNKEGIAYSMTQWYPKISEYDYQGWHAYQYVAREFHGVWGDFDVKISIDADFTIGGTGILQNPEEIGHGYEAPETHVKKTKGKLTWHFVAKNVHDFAWTADPDYVHTRAQVANGPELHFFYQPGEKTTENWTKLVEYSVKHFEFMNERFGKYPYPTYSIIQGGDGGMEYPMCTLITGERSLGSLVGVMAHEAAHSWFQGVLANNEALYPWMDEGFTDFASDESIARLLGTKEPHKGSYDNYFKLVELNLQEPLGQHSDHYNTNTAYGIAAYSMGSMFLNQIKYLVGEEVFYSGMKRYYNTWKFRHPEPNDFLRVMEKESGLQLHWFYRYWILATKHIDYKIGEVTQTNTGVAFIIERKGTLPMPIELTINLSDGKKLKFYVPMNEVMGTKKFSNPGDWKILQTWNWVEPSYAVSIDAPFKNIKSIVIDEAAETADVNRENNIWSNKN